MVVQIPVTKVYELHVDGADATSPRDVNTARAILKDLTVADIEEQGHLLSARTGAVRVDTGDALQYFPLTG